MDYPFGKLILTTNADNPYHPLKVKYVDRGPSNVRLLTSQWRENPHFSAEAATQLEDELRHTPYLYRRLILNEWASSAGLVFEIDPRTMVRHTDHEKRGIVVIDPGVTGVTAALLFVKVSYGWHVAGEYLHDRVVGGQLSDDQHLDRILGLGWAPTGFVLDPVTGGNYQAIIRRRGWRAELAELDVQDGIVATTNALYSGRLTIEPSLIDLLQSVAVYAMNPLTDKPDKGSGPSHLPDCLRYGGRHLFPFSRGWVGGLHIPGLAR